MSHATVKVRIESALTTVLGTVPIVDMDNVVPAVPIDGDGFPTTFVSVFYVGMSAPLDIGAPEQRQWREQGSVSVTAFSPSGAGTVDTLLQSVRTYFEQNPGLGGLTVHTVSDGSASPPMPENRALGNYWSRSLVLGYQFDY